MTDRTLLPQDAYTGLKNLGVDLIDISRIFSHVKDNKAEWDTIEAELLHRCRRGDQRICGMGFIDDVRREWRAQKIGEFKVNNNWSPLYCRLFVVKWPEYRDRFVFKKLKRAA